MPSGKKKSTEIEPELEPASSKAAEITADPMAEANVKQGPADDASAAAAGMQADDELHQQKGNDEAEQKVKEAEETTAPQEPVQSSEEARDSVPDALSAMDHTGDTNITTSNEFFVAEQPEVTSTSTSAAQEAQDSGSMQEVYAGADQQNVKAEESKQIPPSEREDQEQDDLSRPPAPVDAKEENPWGSSIPTLAETSSAPRQARVDRRYPPHHHQEQSENEAVDAEYERYQRRIRERRSRPRLILSEALRGEQSSAVDATEAVKGEKVERGVKRHADSIAPSDREEPGSEMAEAPSEEGEQQKKAESADTGRPEKKARRAPLRGMGMLGLLESTLTQAKAESAARSRDTGALRRSNVESRLANRQQRELEAKRRKSDQKGLEREVLRLAEAISAGEAELKSLRSQKRRLASFLVTKAGAPRPKGRAQRDPNKIDSIRSPLVEASYDIPSSIPPDRQTPSRSAFSSDFLAINEAETYPIYYLPKKLLDFQEDMLDDQEDRVDEAIEDADDAWAARRKDLQKQLEEAIAKLEDFNSEDSKLMSQGALVNCTLSVGEATSR